MPRSTVVNVSARLAATIAMGVVAAGANLARADCPPDQRETVVVRPEASTVAAAMAPFEVTMAASATGMLNVRLVLERARPEGRVFERLYLRRHAAPAPAARAEEEFANWLRRAQESREVRVLTPTFSTRNERALVWLMIRADEAAHTLVEIHYASRGGLGACRVYLAPLGSWAAAAGVLPPTNAEAAADAASAAAAAAHGQAAITPPAPESFLLSPEQLAELLRPPMLPAPERRKR